MAHSCNSSTLAKLGLLSQKGNLLGDEISLDKDIHEGRGDGAVSKTAAVQAWGPEFDPRNHIIGQR